MVRHGSKETWFDGDLRTWFEGIINGDMDRMGKNGILRHGSKVHTFKTENLTPVGLRMKPVAQGLGSNSCVFLLWAKGLIPDHGTGLK